MDWFLRQLARIYAAEQYRLQMLVGVARDQMAQALRDEIDAAGGSWQADDVRFNDRMVDLHRRLDVLLAALMLSMLDRMLSYETAAYRLGYYGAAWQMNVTPREHLFDPNIVAIMNAPYIDATLMQRLFDVRTQFETQARRVWVESQTEGENAKQVLARMNQAWGTTAKPDSRSLWFKLAVIAESEFYRAANLGGTAAMGSHATLLQGKEWFTREDEKVCPRCGKLDKVIVPLDAEFVDEVGGVKVSESPLHTRCRCYTLPVLLGGERNASPYPTWATKHGVEPGMDGRAVLM